MYVVYLYVWMMIVCYQYIIQLYNYVRSVLVQQLYYENASCCGSDTGTSVRRGVNVQRMVDVTTKRTRITFSVSGTLIRQSVSVQRTFDVTKKKLQQALRSVRSDTCFSLIERLIKRYNKRLFSFKYVRISVLCMSVSLLQCKNMK
jgi:hypothetical protein